MTTDTRRRRDLGTSFREHFELVPALDDATRDLVYQIRHEVYCRDLGWESVREDGRESDQADKHSVHCLLRLRGSGDPVGCLRLVLTRPECPEQPLPFETSCRDVIDRTLVDPAALPRATVGEVSRLAVLKRFRQRKGEAGTPVSVMPSDFAAERVSDAEARFPFIAVGLYLGGAALAVRLGVEHVFVLTEPRLAGHFARIGFDIRVVGGPIEHRGLRVPSMMSSSRVVAGLRPLIRPLYAVIAESIESSYAKLAT